jgi:hypothetical protein
MTGRLTAPKAITDYDQNLICFLPVGFYLDDERWERIWQRYEEKGAPLSREDLRQMFPDEAALQVDLWRVTKRGTDEEAGPATE